MEQTTELIQQTPSAKFFCASSKVLIYGVGREKMMYIGGSKFVEFLQQQAGKFVEFLQR